MARTYSLISADSHLDFSPDRWTHRVPERWRDRAPRVITLDDGQTAEIIENRPVHRIGGNRLGTAQAQDKFESNLPTFQGLPGRGSPEQRLAEQDQDGVEAEILFTHDSYLNYWRGIQDDRVLAGVVHGYNEFLAEEYCALAPDRLLAMGVVPPTNVDDAVAELEYCARAGFKGVCLYKYPSGKVYPTPEDDRFWAASLDLRMPITGHTVAATTRFTGEGPAFLYPRKPARNTGDPITLIFRFCGDAAFTPIQMAYAGVFDRFPDLKLYWGETQIGWLPFALWMIDDSYERYGAEAKSQWGLEPLERRPSEYLRDQNLWGFLTDPVGVEMRHKTGVHALMWGSDFAHPASDWPNSRMKLDEAMAGVPDDERNLMLAGNAVRFFHLDE